MPQIHTFLNKIADPLGKQFLDLRSGITNEVCKTVQVLAEIYANDFAKHAGNTFVTDKYIF